MSLTDLDVAVRAARAGAAEVRPRFRLSDRADFKGAGNPVTEADTASEAAILDILGQFRPGDAILAEESGGVAAAEGRRWLVDPLDGTVNYLHGLAQVGVAVALYEGVTPRVAVVVDVFGNEEFTALEGGGAACNGSPMAVSARLGLGEALVATGFPYDRRRHSGAYLAAFERVMGSARDLRRVGAASLDLAWVAAGRYDAFWEYLLAPWDVAAGILLVREAGGMVTDHLGNPTRPGDAVVVASNGRVHEALRSIIEETVPPHVVAGHA